MRLLKYDFRQAPCGLTSDADGMYQALFLATPDAILIMDHDETILFSNRAAEALFGYLSCELYGLSFDTLLPTQKRHVDRNNKHALAEDLLSRFMRGGINLMAIRKDGSEFLAELSTSSIDGENGTITICVLRNSLQHKCREREQGLRLMDHHRNLQALTAKLVVAEESERRRIAIGLHDDVGQSLTTAKMDMLELLEANLSAEEATLAQKVLGLVDHAIQNTRSLTFELASAALYEIGLEAALQSACEHAENQSGIQFQPPSGFQGQTIPESISVILYRVGRQLIRNIMEHSKADIATITLDSINKQIHLTVADDGCGFAASKSLSNVDTQSGIGLLSITQQLVQIGGRLKIQSSPENGTQALIIVPLDSKREEA